VLLTIVDKKAGVLVPPTPVCVALDKSKVAPLGTVIVSPDAPIVIVSAFH
jgi:hypothetical protein